MRMLPGMPETGIFDAVVDRVVDGDTIDVAMLVPLRIRLHGIQKSEDGTLRNQMAVQLLKERLPKQVIQVDLRGRDERGQMLARARTDAIADVSDWLISLRLATQCDDDRKPKPSGRPWAELAKEDGPK